MAAEQQPEPQPERHCRLCFGGERGLADALIEPCDCRGTLAFTHVSCLHAWRLQKAVQLRDAGRCEVCGARYRVPDGAWRAFAASADAGGAVRLRLQRLWQQAAPALAGAAAAALLLARAVLKARHLWQWLGQSCMICIGAEEALLPPKVLPPCAARLLPAAELTGRWLLLDLLLLHRTLGDWRAVRLLPAWRAALHTAAACAAFGAALLLQRTCDVRWDAPGAPAKQPMAAQLADSLLQLATVVAAVNVSNTPAFLVALLGPLAPRAMQGRSDLGFVLLRRAAAVASVEQRLRGVAAVTGALFRERPQALAALHAALA